MKARRACPAGSPPFPGDQVDAVVLIESGEPEHGCDTLRPRRERAGESLRSKCRSRRRASPNSHSSARPTALRRLRSRRRPRRDRDSNRPLVIPVSDWERSNRFYADVLGARVSAAWPRRAYRFGEQQLNVHGPGFEPDPVAGTPVAPGDSDLCFVWPGTIEDAVEHLQRHGVPIEAEPADATAAAARDGLYFAATRTAACSSSLLVFELAAGARSSRSAAATGRRSASASRSAPLHPERFGLRRRRRRKPSLTVVGLGRSRRCACGWTTRRRRLDAVVAMGGA